MSAKVKAIFLASVVVIVAPFVYALCKVAVDPPLVHGFTLFDASKQSEVVAVPEPKPVKVTRLFAASVVNAPVPAVVEPIGPGEAKVAPLRLDAFKLATLVLEVTMNGAVPLAIVDVS